MSFPRPPRSTWAALTDDQLLAQCEVDTYRASGPGGQKRNKTSSAVWLRHLPTGLLVIGEESRSQHENKAKCLKRLRQALYLHLRDPVVAELLPTDPDVMAAKDADGRFHLGFRDPRFWPLAGIILDVLTTTEGQVSTAAELLGTSTANLIAFLQTDPKVWQEANRTRAAFGALAEALAALGRTKDALAALTAGISNARAHRHLGLAATLEEQRESLDG